MLYFPLAWCNSLAVQPNDVVSWLGHVTVMKVVDSRTVISGQ